MQTIEYFKEQTHPLPFNGLCTPFGSPVIGGQKPSMEGSIYNHQGQRINKLQKGIKIIDGKKIMVK